MRRTSSRPRLPCLGPLRAVPTAYGLHPVAIVSRFNFDLVRSEMSGCKHFEFDSHPSRWLPAMASVGIRSEAHVMKMKRPSGSFMVARLAAFTAPFAVAALAHC